MCLCGIQQPDMIMKTTIRQAWRLVLAAIMAFGAFTAGSENFTVKRFEAADLLPSTTVKVFFQDADGYLWLGTTNGLSRWDGYRLVDYASDPSHPARFGSNDILSIWEGPDKSLYVGTTDGLCRLGSDRRTVTVPPADSPLSKGEIRALAYIRHKRVGERLRETEMGRRNAEDLARLKLRYVANVSHDFLTPVSIIGCVADEIERGEKGVSASQLSAIRENLRKIRRLVEEALDIRSLDRDEMRLELKCGDLAEFVRSVCHNHFAAAMESRQIEFGVEVPVESRICRFDPDKLEKIVFNLLGNAYKYTMPGGSVRVRVEYRDGTPSDPGEKTDRTLAVLTVEDTGKGMTEEVKSRIFERYYGDTGDGANLSHGLGLSIVKEFVELHGGSVAVESEPGKGSVFTVSLLVEIEKGKVCPEVADVEQKAAAPDGEDDRKPRLLIVEDNAELLEVMARMLGERYCVTVAHDGEEGLEAASGQLPDIIVADVMMPRLDGLELTRRLKENIDTSHIPIILLTARNSPDDRVECYRAGADGYISKPFETKVLEARIDNIISSRRKERETLHRQPDSNPVEVASSPLDKEFIEKLVGLVSRNLLDSDVDMDFVAEKMAMSRSSFYRKVKTLTGLSPMEFVKNVKLKHAYELLRTTDMSVAEVAYSSGFNNPKYFTMCFKAEFGTTPRQVRGGRTEK